MTTSSSEAFKRKYIDQLSTKYSDYLLYDRQKNVAKIQISLKKTMGYLLFF